MTTPQAEAMDADGEVGMGSVGSTGKGRRRRVSFAMTKTIHVIPRNEDFGSSPDEPHLTSPPSDHGGGSSTDAHDSTATAASISSSLTLHTADWSFVAASDMDTTGSWTTDVAAGTEEEARAPVFLWHISYDDKSDTLVGDDTTVNEITLSRHLSEVLDTCSENSLFLNDESRSQIFCPSRDFISSEKCCSSSGSLIANCASLDTRMNLTEFTPPILSSESEQILSHRDVDPSDMSIVDEYSKDGTDKLIAIWDHINLESFDQAHETQRQDCSPKREKFSNLLNVPKKTSDCYSLAKYAKKGCRLSHAKGKENMSHEKFPLKAQTLNAPVKRHFDNIKSVYGTRTKLSSHHKEFSGHTDSSIEMICDPDTKGKFLNNRSETSFAEDTTAIPSLSDMLAADPDSVNCMLTNNNILSILHSAKVIDDNDLHSHSVCRRLQNEDITVLAPRITDVLPADSSSFFLTPLFNQKKALNSVSPLSSVSLSKEGVETKKKSGFGLLHNKSNDNSSELIFSDNSMEIDETNAVVNLKDKTKGVQFDSNFNSDKVLPQISEKHLLNILGSKEKGRSGMLVSDCLELPHTEYGIQRCESEEFIEKVRKKAFKEDTESKVTPFRNNGTQCDRQVDVEVAHSQPRLSCMISSLGKSQTPAGSRLQVDDGLCKSLNEAYTQESSLKKRANAEGQQITVNEMVIPEEILGSNCRDHPLLQDCGNESRAEGASVELLKSKSHMKHEEKLKSAKNMDSFSMVQKLASKPIKCMQSMEDDHISVKEIIDVLEEKGAIVSEHLRPEDWDGIVPEIIAKPETIQEHLIFSCFSRPQVEIFLESMEQLQRHIDCMKQKNAKLRASISKFESVDALSVKRLKHDRLFNLQQFYEWNYRLESKCWLMYLNAHITEMHNFVEDYKPLLIDSINEIKSGMPKLVTLHEDSLILLNKLSLFDQAKVGKIAPQMVDWKTKLSQAKDKLMKSSEKLQEARERLGTLKYKIYHAVRHCRKEPGGSEEDLNIDTMKSAASDAIMKYHILKELQLMQVTMTRSVAHRKFIELSYSDLIVQRFEYIDNGLAAEVDMSFVINHSRIETAFPFMNATAAFQNVVLCLSNECNIQLRAVPLVIQKTNWLLGSLIDILLELRDCCRAFQSSAHFLFADAGDYMQVRLGVMYSQIKVAIVFTMDFMKRGVYPRDLWPLNVEVQVEDGDGDGKDGVTVSALQKKVASVKPGFDRIKRICASVYEFIRSEHTAHEKRSKKFVINISE